MKERHIYLIVSSHLSISSCSYIRVAVINRIWIEAFIPVLSHFQRWYEEAVC